MAAREGVEFVPAAGMPAASALPRSVAATRRGLAMIFLAVLLWGSVAPTMQLLTFFGPADGRSVGFFRIALSLPILLLATWRTTGQLRFAVSRTDLGLLFGFGLCMALFQPTFFGAIAGIGGTASTLITVCLPPLVVTLVAARLRGERPAALVVVALVTAIVGAALTVLDSAQKGLGPAVIIGGLLALVAALCTAGGTLIVRSLVERHHPLRVVTVAFTVAALMLLLGTIPGGLTVSFAPAGWLLLAYLALVPTALAYVLFLRGIASTTATVGSIALVLEPLTTALLVWALFGHMPGALGLLGALLLLGASVALTRGA